jgi:hypothetical protein
MSNKITRRQALAMGAAIGAGLALAPSVKAEKPAGVEKASTGVSASTVAFSPEGNFLVNGKPFFPIGIWIYDLNPDVLADLREHHFNTVVGLLKPAHVKPIEEHELMMIPPASDDFLAVAASSPSLLGWYLEDEPEEHNVDPAVLKKKFDATKKREPTHPIGVTHNQLIGPEKYKESGDFTMTDLYPVTAKRDWPLGAVGRYAAEPKRVHGDGWPVLFFVQTFGGPETDGGLWAQPLPHEVRFMVFDALVSRVNGIFYFSYWPRAANTWAEVAKINAQLRRLTPWLVGNGQEVATKASAEPVRVRARRAGDSWMVIVVNSSPKELEVKLSVEGLPDGKLRMPFDAPREVRVKSGAWAERLEGHEVKVYLAGDDLPL